jgi:hypothetical protein
MPNDHRDIVERLVDFDGYGVTATERVKMRMDAWHEIRKLREEVERLTRPNPVTNVLKYRSTAERIEDMPPIGEALP